MEWLPLGVEIYLILFFVAMLAGFIDSIAGGGGLISLPALMSVGIPPAQALATNKLQSIGGSFSASLYFIRQKAVDLKDQRWTILLTFIGAMFGAILIQHIEADILRSILPLLIIAIGLYFVFSPKVGEADRQKRLTTWPFAFVAGFCVGFYDGFFGPGAGSFFALAYVTLRGFNLTKSTAHAKVLNFTSNLASLLFFILGGKVVWSVGLVMLCGQVIGARTGARMVLTKGQKLIRPMLITVSFVMSCKLIYDNHSAEIHQWIAGFF
ncbi:sulfite exporter TauE/SafE family protein [Jinshanibacter sp. LJY008]|uniref:Probable membrane transporter protein n=1 Tax=Limnobaculum eriocheiris TaxID=2897391 RepID=A0A9X1MXE0_9GAMM|nr:sulfite exporter TauE/SafE family protein [Limnobaculum eriocheiris]MCD1126313.1 sulfite exporter TauE/SafE family protein [Limnobaculum eriocheiris]